MGAYRFSMAPNISVPRSKFRMPFTHSTSFLHGKLVPVDCFEILPGDEFKADFSALIRMATPIAPIMGNIKAHVHAFFVPMRLVWSHTKEFYGENNTSAGYQTQSYSIPSAALGSQNDVQALSHYLGKPLTSVDVPTTVSVLKERGYYLIWNEYYRAQQLQNPVLIQTGDTGSIGTITGGHGLIEAGTNTVSIGFGTYCMNVCKEFDYFTACTTAPQYGSAVTLPLGTYAPVGILNNTNSSYSATNPQAIGSNSSASANSFQPLKGVVSNIVNNNYPLVADLANATAASINTIRYAFQVQKWLERANFGSRFFEMLNLHYGVTSPDARLQRPEYLGGFDFYINVDQVVSMAGYDASANQDIGQTGAISVTAVKNHNLFHKAFVEPGYVYLLISTTHERLYSQGILREDSRKDRFDFYFPEFANLGDQAVLAKEIYANNSLANANEVNFGYQEHWAEYRYRPNRVSGLLNPNAANSLDFWTLAEKFTNIPTLSNSFIMENRNDLARALTTGSNGPDYIADFHVNYTAIREMPLYTIPGLVDHFGVM